jgi:hypothetical protein
MVTELQFMAIGGFLLWGLIAALTGILGAKDETGARLVWREHGPSGWSDWRSVHSGLTPALSRTLAAADEGLDEPARADVLHAVMLQNRDAASQVLQFAVIHAVPTAEGRRLRAVFVSGGYRLYREPSEVLCPGVLGN